jgi:DNA-binding NtrC family response regulator/tetratricopeptide (TPR) repeat protein
MEANDVVGRALREGRFLHAHQVVLKNPPTSDVDRVSAAELLHLVGKTHEAARIAARLSQSGRLPDDLHARCALIIAEAKWQVGKLKEALELYRKAATLAEKVKDKDLICRTSAFLLERTTDSSGFDASVQLARQVRKALSRIGDPQLRALVHLTFGRLEAKVGHLAVAQRHIGLARIAIEVDPNLQLQAAADLDEASVLWLTGDVRGSLALTERGASGARDSGWARGRATAGANLAWLCVCAGRFAEARGHLRATLDEPSLSPSLHHALADTESRLLLAEGDFATVTGRLGARAADPTIESWYRLTAEQTHVQTLLRMGRPAEALDRAKKAIAFAEATNLDSLLAFFRLAQAEALIEIGRVPTSSELLLRENHADVSLATVGLAYAVLSRGLSRFGTQARAASHSARALRIFEGSGDLAALQHVDVRVTVRMSETDADLPTTAPMHLDAAAALLELSGHPHILGPEAFALIQDTGAAARVALAAKGTTTRIIATEGWRESEAATAIDKASDDDLLTIGQHRDETWVLLAEPKQDLEPRCTLSAIRKLVTTARTLEQFRRDEKQRAALWPAEELEGEAESLWISEQSAELLRIARRIASAPIAVLLTGETGTGKEMLARVIHRASNRADKPFQPFNCTAVPRDMIESQLFGYRKGAFTGAEAPFPGIIRAAAGGTLFLDEIGDVSLDMQPKLLRFLESQEVHPLGEPHAVKVDVRIIAATNGNLDQLVAQGRFREDLLYRLKVLHLHLPPLRERREEIPALTDHYINKFALEQRKGTLTVSDEMLEYLLLYAWPGNIRQLANEIQRIVAFAEPNSTLSISLLSPELRASRRTIGADATQPEEIRLRLDQSLPAAVDTLERLLVRRALERSHGRVEEAARLLGISRKGLFLKRRRWGLDKAS